MQTRALSPASFDGAFTAIATPFRHGEIDFDAVDRIVEHQVAGGITGIVPCGTTGESPALTADEQARLIERCVSRAAGRTLVIAGTGSNSTRETIERTRRAQSLGPDAAMVVMPYYNRPTQRGLVEHVVAVHDASTLPLVIYNVPSRTACDLLAPAVIEIAERCPRVVALKEATGNVLRTQQVHAALGARLAILSGDDALTLGVLACGGRGVISVTSNVAPGAVQGVVEAFHRGDLSGARARHLALLPLHDVLFVETNPGPVKAAMHAMGLLAPEVRLPLVWAGDEAVARVVATLERMGSQLLPSARN